MEREKRAEISNFLTKAVNLANKKDTSGLRELSNKIISESESFKEDDVLFLATATYIMSEMMDDNDDVREALAYLEDAEEAVRVDDIMDYNSKTRDFYEKLELDEADFLHHYKKILAKNAKRVEEKELNLIRKISTKASFFLGGKKWIVLVVLLLLIIIAFSIKLAITKENSPLNNIFGKNSETINQGTDSAACTGSNCPSQKTGETGISGNTITGNATNNQTIGGAGGAPGGAAKDKSTSDDGAGGAGGGGGAPGGEEGETTQTPPQTIPETNQTVESNQTTNETVNQTTQETPCTIENKDSTGQTIFSQAICHDSTGSYSNSCRSPINNADSDIFLKTYTCVNDVCTPKYYSCPVMGDTVFGSQNYSCTNSQCSEG